MVILAVLNKLRESTHAAMKWSSAWFLCSVLEQLMMMTMMTICRERICPCFNSMLIALGQQWLTTHGAALDTVAVALAHAFRSVPFSLS